MMGEDIWLFVLFSGRICKISIIDITYSLGIRKNAIVKLSEFSL